MSSYEIKHPTIPCSSSSPQLCNTKNWTVTKTTHNADCQLQTQYANIYHVFSKRRAATASLVLHRTQRELTFIPTSIGDNSAKGTSRVASSHRRMAKLHMSADRWLISECGRCNAAAHTFMSCQTTISCT